MSISCLFGKHRARPEAVRNQGLEFSRCGGCGRDMVRSRSAWRTVPRGFRVVWRRAGAARGPGLPMAVTPRSREGSDKLRARVAALLAVVGAGLRAFAWLAADRFERWSRFAVATRRPALLRLPAP